MYQVLEALFSLSFVAQRTHPFFLTVHKTMRGDSHVCTAQRSSCFLSKREFHFQTSGTHLSFYKRMLFKVWIRWRVKKKVKSEGSLSDAVSPSLISILGGWFFLSEKVIFLSNEDWCVIDVNRRIWNDGYFETCHKKQMTSTLD